MSVLSSVVSGGDDASEGNDAGEGSVPDEPTAPEVVPGLRVEGGSITFVG